MSQSETNALLQQILHALRSGPSQDPYRDLLTNPNWSWVRINKQNQLLTPNQTVTVYDNNDIVGYIYFLTWLGTSPLLNFVINYEGNGGVVTETQTFNQMLIPGNENDLFKKLTKYDTTGSLFAAEQVPGFPGLPINGSLSLTMTNNDTVDAYYSVVGFVYQYTGP